MAKKKRKAKVVKLQPSLSPSKYIKKFGRTLEIHEVLWSSDIFEIGKGTVAVVRKKRNGDIIIGSYLIDTYCLGVKDTHYRIMRSYEYEEFREYLIEMAPSQLENIDANFAFNIIYGALEYAEDLGIEPHKDFPNTEYLLPLPEDLEFVDLEFGLNGKPCYMYSEGDRKAEILNKLTKAVGPDGFTFVDELPFLDDIDGEYGDEFYDDNEEDFIETAEERYETESEKSAFIFFASIIHYWHNDFGDYFEDLENMFNYNKHKVCRLIKEEFAGIYDFEGDKIKDEVLLAITEKYLIYGGTDFIYDDVFLDTFDISTKELEIASMIGTFNLSKYGDEKIQELLNTFLILTKDERKGKNLEEYLKEFNDNLGDDNFKPDHSLLLILDLINDHEAYYGPIDWVHFKMTDI